MKNVRLAILLAFLQAGLYACSKKDNSTPLPQPAEETPPLKYLSELRYLQDTSSYHNVFYDSLMQMKEVHAHISYGYGEPGLLFIRGGYINNRLSQMYWSSTKDFSREVAYYEILYNQQGTPQKVMYKGNTQGSGVVYNYDSLVYDNISRLTKVYTANLMYDKTVVYTGKYELTNDVNGDITDVAYGKPNADLSKNFTRKTHYTYDKNRNPHHIPRDYLFWLYYYVLDFPVLSRHNVIQEDVYFFDYFKEGVQKATTIRQYTYDEDDYPVSYSISSPDSAISYPQYSYKYVKP